MVRVEEKEERRGKRKRSEGEGEDEREESEFSSRSPRDGSNYCREETRGEKEGIRREREKGEEKREKERFAEGEFCEERENLPLSLMRACVHEEENETRRRWKGER